MNLALARLGESPVQSLDEGSVAANVARSFYDPARRTALRDYNWNFALQTTTLARLALTPVGFSYAYAMPSDCLKALRLRSAESTSEWGMKFILRGGVLLADIETAVLEYVADVTDTGLFDDHFIEALTYKLASELAMPVKGSMELMANYANMYQSRLIQAASLSLNEQHLALSENPYAEARGDGDN